MEDNVAYINHDDELLAASTRAKEQLPALRKVFVAGFQPGEYLEVKAPFTTETGGNEWMWVEVTSWRGTRIGGLLDNEPEHVPGLHSGQHVEVRQEDIFDYLHTFSDKRTEGNTTSVVIQRIQNAAEARKASTFKPVTPACDGP